MMLSSWRLYLVGLIISLLVLQNVSGEFQGGLTNLRKTPSPPPVVTHCSSNGICLHSGACPWKRILTDDIKCIDLHKNFVCCEVVHIVTRFNLFWDYKFI